QHRLAQIDSSGIYQDVGGTERARRRSGTRVERAAIREVARDHARRAAGALDLFAYRCQLRASPCHEHDARARARERESDRATDAGARARHERDMIGEVEKPKHRHWTPTL